MQAQQTLQRPSPKIGGYHRAKSVNIVKWVFVEGLDTVIFSPKSSDTRHATPGRINHLALAIVLYDVTNPPLGKTKNINLRFTDYLKFVLVTTTIQQQQYHTLQGEPDLLADERDYHRPLAQLQNIGAENDGWSTHAHGLKQNGIGASVFGKERQKTAAERAAAEGTVEQTIVFFSFCPRLYGGICL